MGPLPTGIDPASLPDLAHYRSHGIDRITAWCLTPFCCHQGTVTFDELAAHGAGEMTKLLAVKPRLKCTRCGGQHADLQPDWSQRGVVPVAGHQPEGELNHGLSRTGSCQRRAANAPD